jgi:hypothetical protein
MIIYIFLFAENQDSKQMDRIKDINLIGWEGYAFVSFRSKDDNLYHFLWRGELHSLWLPFVR